VPRPPSSTGLDAEATDQRLGQDRPAHDAGRHRQEGQAGLQRVEVLDLLEVERAEEEEREEPAGHEQHGGVRRGQRADPEDAQADQRGAVARLEREEHAQEPEPAEPEAERPGVRPAERLRLDDRVGEHHEPARGQDRAADVEAARAGREPGLRDEALGEHERRDADREVHEEDPLPGQGVGEDAAEQEPERAAARRDGAPARRAPWCAQDPRGTSS
jgi:hypothetical protein